MGLPVRPACLLCASLLILAFAAMPARAAAPLPPLTEDVGRAPEVEVRCLDGSKLRLKMLDGSLTVRTEFGKLVVPLERIQLIECATRTSDDVARRVALAITDLGSSDHRKREAASEELARLHIKAYPALVKLASHTDIEVHMRAERLLEKIRRSVPEEDLTLRKQDVIHAGDSKIAGHLEVGVLRVLTTQFGEVRLKLSDVRNIRSLGAEGAEEESGEVIPDPGHLYSYLGQVGKVLRFRVTGAVTGNVWGTDVYTLDSTLAMAAVHAGLTQVGKPAVVKVRILAGRNAYAGSVRNGVSTSGFMDYPGSFEFIKK